MTNLLNWFWQTILPQHFLSRMMGGLADSSNPKIKNFLCKQAVKTFDINLLEAASKHFSDYKTFNDFFTRFLVPEARPLAKGENTIVCPADGVLSQLGTITEQGSLIQAKGFNYSLARLINDEDQAQSLIGGEFATVYLSPRDYHRVHAPIAGTLIKSEYIPGKLFAVNEKSTQAIPCLMSRNERLVCHFETEIGVVIVVFVAALLVNGIRVKWIEGKPAKGVHTLAKQWYFSKGAELGLFQFGSTAIVISPPNRIKSYSMKKNQSVLMGQQLASF